MPAREFAFSALLLFSSITSFSILAQEISDSSRQVIADTLTARPESSSSVPRAADSLGVLDFLEKHPTLFAFLAALIGAAVTFLIGYWMRRTKRHEGDLTEAIERARRKVEDEFRERDLSLAERRYLEYLKNEHGKISLYGFRTAANVPLSTLEVFVALRLSRAPRAEMPGDAPDPAESDDLTPATVLQRTFGRRQKRLLLIIGDPGSGKTTLMKYFTIRCLERGAWRELGLPKALLPVLVPLHAIDPSLPFAQALGAWATKTSDLLSANLFDRWLSQAGSLVMLDGLDEISDLSKRREVCGWIDRAANFYGNSFFIVTSRYSGYLPDKGIIFKTDFERADVRDLNRTQQQIFLQQWFRAAYQDDRELAGEAAANPEKQSLADTAAVLAFIDRPENKNLQVMAGNPIML